MRFLVAFLWCVATPLATLLATPLRAEPPDRACSTPRWGQVECIRDAHFVFDTCQAIDRFTARHGLDRGFFTRLIWQESRFDPFAVSPAGARGIAQFMPGTAAQRGLSDAFNPAEALEHSAQYLADMIGRFGNLGLAAVGYNGGERRARGLIDGSGGLMPETVSYVQIITGMRAEDWLVDDVELPDLKLLDDLAWPQSCYALARDRRLSPPPQAEPLLPPWGVQLAFGATQKQAAANYGVKTRTCRGLITDETPDYVPVKNRVGGRKGFIMARIGRSSRDKAVALCKQLFAAGCNCRVYRNE